MNRSSTIFRHEFLRGLKSYRTLIFVVFLLILVMYDLHLNWKMIFADYYAHQEAYYLGKPTGFHAMHPCFAAFASSSSLGHLPQIILKWILPVYLLFLYADSFIIEKRSGFYTAQVSRAERKRILGTKLKVAFALPAFLITIVLLVNLFASMIVFSGGLSFMGMEDFADSFTGWMGFSMRHPWFMYIVHILLFAALSGACSLMGCALCMLFPNYLIVYPASFFIWFFLSNMPSSIMSLTQAFADYSDKEMIRAGGIFLLLVLVIGIFGFVYRSKLDEV